MNGEDISYTTDKYFTYSRNIIQEKGDVSVTYAYFLRHHCMTALEIAKEYIRSSYPEAKINSRKEGTIVASEGLLMTVSGSFERLVELETGILQRIGMSCIAAYNSYKMITALPYCSFLDMSARHLSGPEQHELLAYGASVADRKAKQEKSAKGFIGSSTDHSSRIYGFSSGSGSTPHALVGYAAYNLKRDRNFSCPPSVAVFDYFVRSNPEIQNVAILVDYFGEEITDALDVAHFRASQLNQRNKLYEDKNVYIRLDTHGGRFLQNLNYEKSVQVVAEYIEKNYNKSFRNEYAIVDFVLDEFDLANDALIDEVRKHLFGKGVSAAAIIKMRNELDAAKYGYSDIPEPNKSYVGIIASSGFDLKKCIIMSKLNVPIDIVGTGSFIPSTFKETFATADIIEYNGEQSVKLGREHLLELSLD